MNVVFNADEIFEVAEQIERNGAGFYRKAAESSALVRARELLLDLAEQEDEHEKTFAAMRAELSQAEKEATAFDPDNQAVLYLRAIADGRVFDVKSDPSKRLTGRESIEDNLQTALGLEKDSIGFYSGIKELVPPMLGRDRLDEIIAEEMSHIVTLTEQMNASAG